MGDKKKKKPPVAAPAPSAPLRPSKPKTMPLPVELTEAELAVRGKTLAGIAGELGSRRTALEQATEEWREEKKRQENDIDTIQVRILDLAEVIRAGRESREVEVEETVDLKGGQVLIKRKDTGETVASRALTEADRQRTLFAAAPSTGPKA